MGGGKLNDKRDVCCFKLERSRNDFQPPFIIIILLSVDPKYVSLPVMILWKGLAEKRASAEPCQQTGLKTGLDEENVIPDIVTRSTKH